MAAAKRMMHIQTPLLESVVISKHSGKNVWLKLDNCQPAGSFKTRGVGNMCSKAVSNGAKHLVSSSGGNAGLAVAYSARQLGVPATVFVPSTTPEYMRERLRIEGATVTVAGDVWDETNRKALEVAAASTENTYIPPFDHPDIWEGHATVVHELAEQFERPPDLIVVSVGGGGYFCGVCQGLNEVGWTKTLVLAMETHGANALQQSVKAGKLVTLDRIESVAKSLGALCVGQQALKYALNDNVVTGAVSDEQAVKACLDFAEDHKIMVEPACGASLAPLYNQSILRSLLEPKKLESIQTVCVLVCGGNMTRMPMDIDKLR